jgi:hypothetical protein
MTSSNLKQGEHPPRDGQKLTALGKTAISMNKMLATQAVANFDLYDEEVSEFTSAHTAPAKAQTPVAEGRYVLLTASS